MTAKLEIVLHRHEPRPYTRQEVTGRFLEQVWEVVVVVWFWGIEASESALFSL
jgi:hypothetical protein